MFAADATPRPNQQRIIGFRLEYFSKLHAKVNLFCFVSIKCNLIHHFIYNLAEIRFRFLY